MLRPVFAGVTLFVASFALSAKMHGELTAANSRRTAPDFTLRDSKEASVKLSSYRGRVVLLDFWGTFCEICKVEIPWYEEFQTKYEERGFTVLGVSLDKDGWKSVKPFLVEKTVSYPVVIGNWDLAKLFGVDNVLPVSLLIDRNGKIADLHAGIVDKAGWEREIQVLLRDSGLKNTP